jgi:DNA processing protein
MSGIVELTSSQFPALLREITDPPKKLYIKGALPNEEEVKFLAIVGSRKYTPYGKMVCEKLISGLRGYPIVIISGLAIGIDAIAHRAALTAGLHTIAVPGSGIDESVLYPRSNVPLARDILSSGGALISEYEPTFKATTWGFPQRNRLMVGLSDAVLVIEAGEKSGTLITARLASDYNRNLLVVPAPITGTQSIGSNALLRNGGIPILESAHILEELGLKVEERSASLETRTDLSPEERQLLLSLSEPIEKDTLLRTLDIPIHKAQVLLSTLELKGVIVEKFGKVYVV